MRPTARTLLGMVVMVVAGAPRAASQDSREAVLQPLGRLFDGMRAKDTTMILSAFVPEASLVRVDAGDGAPKVGVTAPTEFARLIQNAEPRRLDERIWDVEVRIDDNLAAVWAKYDFLADGAFSHCGTDAFQLLKLGNEWKIVHVADTARRENCWRYPEGG